MKIKARKLSSAMWSDVKSLDESTALFYIMLHSIADDRGVVINNKVSLMASDIGHPNIRNADEMFESMVNNGLLQKYMVDEIEYYKVVNWDRNQGKITNPKYIYPDESGAIPVVSNQKTMSAEEKLLAQQDLAVAEFVWEKVSTVKSRINKPNLNAWAKEIRILRESTGFSHGFIKNVFMWANSDDFWRKNILSTAKLRKHFEALVVKSELDPSSEYDLVTDCAAPIEQIIELFKKKFPSRGVPAVIGGMFEREIKQSWQFWMNKKARRTGKPFYTDSETGLDWWGRLFNYISQKTTLTQEEWFNILWVARKENLEKVISGNYEIKKRA